MDKKRGSDFFEFIWFLIKIPYYLTWALYYILKSTMYKIIWLSGKISWFYAGKKIEKRRKKMTAEYSGFVPVNKDRGDLKKWENDLYKSDSRIGIILGARGSGKTAFGIKMLENARTKTEKNCYAIGFDEEDMPEWIDVVDDVSKIMNDSFVLIDEGGVLFSSRKAMTNANKMLTDLILISRHKNISILFISQNSSNLDVNIIRQADFLILKPSSLLQKDFERKIIGKLYDSLSDNFKKYSGIKGLTYIYSDQFRGFIESQLPSFWNAGISKSFRGR